MELNDMEASANSMAHPKTSRISSLPKWIFAAIFGAALSLPCTGATAQQQTTGQEPKPAAAPANTPEPALSQPGSTSQISAPAASAPAASQSVSAAGSHPQVDPNRYIIGPEDVLQITVWKEPTLSGAVPVRPDGMISMVLAGDLPAAGQTPMQLASTIEEHLKKYIQDPNVSIIVTGVNSQHVYLIGEVGHVGPINLLPDMSPLQAIAAAGGLTPFANSKKIYILRGIPGKQQKIPYNYKQAVKGTSKDDFPLRPGDTIVVP